MEKNQVQNTPPTETRMATGPTNRLTPTLTERMRHRLRVARPTVTVLGAPLPRVITEAGKPDQALLTQTCIRAIDALCDRSAVPIEQLEAIGLAVIDYVRARRGVQSPELGAAMRREQIANAACDVAQWREAGPYTLGDLHTMRERVGEQIIASRDLFDALGREIDRRTPKAGRLAA